MSLLVTFEGVEGSGKTTQIQRVRKYLNRKGIRCIVTREPGGTRIGEKIRKILLSPKHREINPLSELLLYEAARSQHVKEIIQPRSRANLVILCDRFSDASLAYQGYGRRVPLNCVKTLNALATGNLSPDLTFLLDCPTSLGLKRAVRRNVLQGREREGRFELEKARFHQRVRRGYLSIAKKEPERVKVIDTRRGTGKVFEEIRKTLDEWIEAKGKAVQGKR